MVWYYPLPYIVYPYLTKSHNVCILIYDSRHFVTIPTDVAHAPGKVQRSDVWTIGDYGVTANVVMFGQLVTMASQRLTQDFQPYNHVPPHHEDMLGLSHPSLHPDLLEQSCPPSHPDMPRSSHLATHLDMVGLYLYTFAFNDMLNVGPSIGIGSKGDYCIPMPPDIDM